MLNSIWNCSIYKYTYLTFHFSYDINILKMLILSDLNGDMIKLMINQLRKYINVSVVMILRC